MRIGYKPFILSLAMLSATGASAAVIVPVEVPGSVADSTGPIGISDRGVVTGSFLGSDQSLHGFKGTPDGNYTFFDADVNGTQARGINDAGWVTGFSGADTCKPFNCLEFEMTPEGVIGPITKDGQQLMGIVQGIKSNGIFVGDYHPPGAASRYDANAYVGYQGHYVADLTLPFPTPQTKARGINGAGTVVGFFWEDIAHGFVLRNGVVTVIDYPDPNQTGTFLEGINDRGWIVGQWGDAAGNSHGFLLDPALQTFTDIVPPGATFVQTWSVNNSGEVVGSSDIGGFIYCMTDNGRCNGLKAKHVAAHSVAAKPFKTYSCVHNCRYEKGAPDFYVSPAGSSPEPADTVPDLRKRPYARRE